MLVTLKQDGMDKNISSYTVNFLLFSYVHNAFEKNINLILFIILLFGSFRRKEKKTWVATDSFYFLVLTFSFVSSSGDQHFGRIDCKNYEPTAFDN